VYLVLKADRERVAAEEAARREAKETAAREHEEKVMEQRRQEEDERAYRSIVESKRAGLGAEPEEGEGVIQLQVRMPDGTRLARRFCTSDTMAYVFDFVDVSVAEQAEGKPHELMPGSYKLATQFPRRVFTAGQEGKIPASLSRAFARVVGGGGFLGCVPIWELLVCRDAR
jgi:hypothetical protein